MLIFAVNQVVIENAGSLDTVEFDAINKQSSKHYFRSTADFIFIMITISS